MSESAWVVLVAWLSVVGDVTPPVGWEARPEFTLAVREIALREEWLAEWEQTPCLAEIRARRDACKGLPRLSVLQRMPSENWLDEQRRFGTEHREWLAKRMELEVPGPRLWYLEQWLADAQALDRIYYDVSYAHCDIRQRYCSVVSIRERLGRVRDWIGEDALERGVLPPVVPVWRFRRVP